MAVVRRVIVKSTLNGSSKANRENYPAGPAGFIGEYMRLLVEDASRAMLDVDRAKPHELSAMARLENGARGHCRDGLVHAVAALTGQPPKTVFTKLLIQAALEAHRNQKKGNQHHGNRPR